MDEVSIGRIVIYALTEEDVVAIEVHRAKCEQVDHRTDYVLARCAQGNPVHAGQMFPLVVTAVFSPQTVNGQVLLDGNDTLWVTSREFDEDAFQYPSLGKWIWPVRTTKLTS